MQDIRAADTQYVLSLMQHNSRIINSHKFKYAGRTAQSV